MQYDGKQVAQAVGYKSLSMINLLGETLFVCDYLAGQACTSGIYRAEMPTGIGFPVPGVGQCAAYSWLIEAGSDRYDYNTSLTSRS